MHQSERVDHALLEALEPHRISVHLAALLLAIDASGWSVNKLGDEDFAPYMVLDEARPDDWGVWRRVHSWIDIEPVGAVSAGRDAIQRRLLEDIENGRLYAIRVRRNEAGEIDPRRTQLHFEDINTWIEVNGLEPVDNWNQYWDDEDSVLNAAIEAAEVARAKLRTGAGTNRPAGTTPTIDELEDRLHRLIAENMDLRQQSGSSAVVHVAEREPRSALVLIGSLINLILSSTPGKQRISVFGSQAAVIEALLANFPHTRGLSERNVEDLFAKGKRAFQDAGG